MNFTQEKKREMMAEAIVYNTPFEMVVEFKKAMITEWQNIRNLEKQLLQHQLDNWDGETDYQFERSIREKIHRISQKRSRIQKKYENKRHELRGPLDEDFGPVMVAGEWINKKIVRLMDKYNINDRDVLLDTLIQQST